jgi:membrane associated rhomboid family serine protease
MTTEIATCYRHQDRRAGVSCQRCGRPICPSCMVQASVGFHCPDCARAGAAQVHTSRTLFASQRPLVTLSLVVINAIWFVADLATATGAGLMQRGTGELSRWGLLVGFGTFDGQTAVGVAAGEWWRIFTGGFLHAGLFHIGMNMLVLWILGSQLEPVLGRVRFLALYVTSLLAGSFGVLLVSPTAATVGASGAVFGLMGAAFAAQKAWGIDPWRSGIGTLIILNIVITFLVPGISIGGHIGGLIGGAITGFVLFKLESVTKSAFAAVAACGAISVALFLGCLWAADQWMDPVFGYLA